MFPLSGLPRCVALRSKHDNSYLRCVHDESQGGNVVELCSGGEGEGEGGVMNPRCRFYLEASKEHEGQLHVRCCYNNKYWVPQQTTLPGGSAPSWIIGTAHEPEEDLSKPSCTLFKLSIPEEDVVGEDGFTACRFVCSQLGKYAGVLSSTSSDDMVTKQGRSYLHIAHEEETDDQDNNNLDVDGFSVRDLSRQMQLPKHIAFKGDNGCLLAAYISGGHNYLHFLANDIGAASVPNTVFTNNLNGVVRMKSNYYDKYWRRSPNWIWADSTDMTSNNPDTLFTVISGDGFIALKNHGNNNFCCRLSTDGKVSCLNASASTIVNEGKLRCYEPVISREIYNVKFRLDEAKIYTTGVDGLASQNVNNTTNSVLKTTVNFTYKRTQQSSWSSTVSMKIDVKAHLKAGIPFLIGGSIDTSAEFNASYEWGKTESEERQINQGVDVEVPPMKKVTVQAIGSNGVCDIPFSYTQRDVLMNGGDFIQEFTDGLYVGVKTSEVTFNIGEEDL